MTTEDLTQIEERVRATAEQVHVSTGDDIAARLRARARKVRRRRVARNATASAAAVGIALAAIVSLWPSSTGRDVVVTGPGNIAGKLSGIGVTPSGWVRVDYGNASIAVPARWKVLWGDQHLSPEPNDVVFLSKGEGSQPLPIGPVLPPGSEPPPTSFAGLSALLGDPPAGSPVNTNGHAGVHITDTNPTVSAAFAYPDLGVVLVVAGPQAEQVASTIGWSSSYIALHPAAATSVPSSWKSVNYEGIKFQVPATWPEHDLTASNFTNPGQCGGSEFYKPLVDTGSSSLAVSCPYVPPTVSEGVDAVWARPYPLPNSGTLPAGSVTGDFNDRMFVFLPGSTFDDIQPVLHVLIRLPSTSPSYQNGAALVIDIGLGPDPTVAQDILTSLSLNAYLPIARNPGTVPPASAEHLIQIPALAGDPLDQAEAILSSLGLQTTVNRTASTTAPVGTVISEAPPAGSEVVIGSTVTLEASSGPTH